MVGPNAIWRRPYRGDLDTEKDTRRGKILRSLREKTVTYERRNTCTYLPPHPTMTVSLVEPRLKHSTRKGTTSGWYPGFDSGTER